LIALLRRLSPLILVYAACATPDTEVFGPPPDPVSVPRACTDATPAPAAPGPLDVPMLPVGYDAFRQWERWPIVRLGTRAYLRSTYERAGGNYDASHFLRREADQFVTLDVAGSGVLHFSRTNHWHGSPWHYQVDGNDTVVRESSTADPDHPVSGSTFLPEALFPEPLAVTWSTTQGADLSWVPIPFSSTLEVRYERTHYGTGYYIYSLYPEGATNLSRTPCTWERTAPPEDVRALLRTTAEDIAKGVGKSVRAGTLDVAASGTTRVERLVGEGPTTLRALSFDVAQADAAALGRATLRVTWDDRSRPSIEAPLQLFFGTGSLFNRDGREYLVRAFPMTVHFAPPRVRFTTILPMPFARSATIEIVGAGEAIPGVRYEVRSEPRANEALGYLHATYRDVPVPVPGYDNVLLDTTVDEGGGEWCGSFIGTSFTFSDRANLTTLEGDPRFFFDDSGTPQGQGTGTEEWGGGGDYWGGQLMTLPFAGHPVGAPGPSAAKGAEDQIESAYRFLLSDAMPFGRNARIQLEHGAIDDGVERSRSVTYWYGLPSACLTLSDSFHVGDPDDERAHDWTAVGEGDVVSLSSRYELGIDRTADGIEVHPETTDSGRTVQAQSTFRIAIARDNVGVMLRRKLDYALADQRAVVSIADDRDDAPFVRAGVWYLAGGTSTVFSDAKEETGPPDAVVQPSNRRFRDDEFLLPRALTEGRSRLRVRLDVVPQTAPIAPGAEPPARGWSALRYWAYSYRVPPAP
jgi:hypothetical protein